MRQRDAGGAGELSHRRTPGPSFAGQTSTMACGWLKATTYDANWCCHVGEVEKQIYEGLANYIEKGGLIVMSKVDMLISKGDIAFL